MDKLFGETETLFLHHCMDSTFLHESDSARKLVLSEPFGTMGPEYDENRVMGYERKDEKDEFDFYWSNGADAIGASHHSFDYLTAVALHSITVIPENQKWLSPAHLDDDIVFFPAKCRIAGKEQRFRLYPNQEQYFPFLGDWDEVILPEEKSDD